LSTERQFRRLKTLLNVKVIVDYQLVIFPINFLKWLFVGFIQAQCYCLE